jgi:hypothetical protein
MPYDQNNPAEGGGFWNTILGPVGNNVLGPMWSWLGGNQGTSNLQQDRSNTAGYLNSGSPYIDKQSPYAGQQAQLLEMLKNRSQGNGPSVAGDAYKSASSDAMSRAATLSNSGNAGATRLALQQMGNQEQGLSQGYSAARNQEMMGATGQYGAALNSADSSQLLRDKANQEAWLQMLKDMYGGDSALTQGSKNNGDMLGSIIKAIAF